MQAAEYRERFKQGVEVAQEAIASAANAGNGAQPSGDGKVAVAGSKNGAGRAAEERTPSAA
jgi:hypothetical protein